MGKNIYEMLNDVKINEDEYERMELTEFDKAQKQKRILKKIKKNIICELTYQKMIKYLKLILKL